MFIKNRTCVKNKIGGGGGGGGGGGTKLFDMEFGGVLKINILLLEAVSGKSEMLGISHPFPSHY